MNNMYYHEIGYLAGIFDGEGWIVTSKDAGVGLFIAMTDFDVIEKIHRQTGIGRLEGPRTTKTGSKPQLKWCVTRQDDLETLLHAILPFLSERRSMRALEAIAFIEDHKAEANRRLTEFICGHHKSEENTYQFKKSNRTACRKCILDKGKARYQANKAINV